MYCPKCKEFLCTEDIWCYSTVKSEEIVIMIQCLNCNWIALQNIKFSDFKEKKKDNNN